MNFNVDDIVANGCCLSYEEFLETVKERIEEHFDNTTKISITSVVKNNGVSFDCLIIAKEKGNIAPSIYLKECYEEYKRTLSIEGVISKIINSYYKSMREANFDVDEICQYNKIRGRIVYKLVNCKDNKEYLEDIVYDRILDLAKCYGLIFENNNGLNGMMLIKEEHIAMWKTTREDIVAAAEENTARILKPVYYKMTELLKSYDPENENILDMLEGDYPELYVLTNNKKFNGAAVVLYEGILEEIADSILEDDLYVIPSSVHEVIIAGKHQGFDLKALKEITRTINDTVMQKEEILSYTIYEYDRSANKLYM